MGVIYKNGIPYGGGSSDVSSLQDIFDKDNTQDVVGDNTLSFIQNDAKIDLSDPEAVEEFENSSSYKGLEIDNDHITLESGESNIDFSLNHEEVEMNAKLKSSFREALGIVDGGGHTIEDQTGTDLTQRSNMQFVDSHLTDDSTNDRTKVEVIKPISKEDLDELGAGTDGFYVTPEEDDDIPASDIDYDNTASELSSTKVQGAIDELAKPVFTEASTRANIASGEKISTLFGKIKKFFTDLKAVAFSGSYNDLSDKPTIPTNNNQLTNGAGYITSSGSCSYATSAGSASSATNADKTDGYHASESATASTLVARDKNKFIYGTFYNSDISDENISSYPNSTAVMFTSSDKWIRRTNKANFKSWLGYSFSRTLLAEEGGMGTWSVSTNISAYNVLIVELQYGADPFATGIWFKGSAVFRISGYFDAYETRVQSKITASGNRLTQIVNSYTGSSGLSVSSVVVRIYGVYIS